MFKYQTVVETMKKLFKIAAVGVTGAALSLSSAIAEEWRFNNFLPETRPESAQL